MSIYYVIYYNLLVNAFNLKFSKLNSALISDKIA